MALTAKGAMWPHRPRADSPDGLRDSRNQQGGTSDLCVPRQRHSQPQERKQRNGGGRERHGQRPGCASGMLAHCEPDQQPRRKQQLYANRNQQDVKHHTTSAH